MAGDLVVARQSSGHTSFARTTPAPEPLTRSLEVGDSPRLHDSVNNYIPAACFETALALILLDNPGKVGEFIDQQTQALAEVLDGVYDSVLGEQQFVVLDGKLISLRELVETKMIHEVRPGTNEIARSDRDEDAADWLLREGGMGGKGQRWLREQLRTPSGKGQHRLLLLKIKTIILFGEIIWGPLKNLDPDMLASNREAFLAMLPGHNADSFDSLRERIKSDLRHARFDAAETRARCERAPIIDGKSLAGNPMVRLGSGNEVGVGFGTIYHASFIADLKLRARYVAEEESKTREGIPRMGDPIEDKEVPGLLTAFALRNMPQAFRDLGLHQLLDDHRINHGSGLSRWMLKGSSALKSWGNNKPAVGCHSGGTMELLFGLGCLNRADTFFGNKALLEPAGLAAAIYMIFCTSHSLVETLTEALALIRGEVFQVPVPKEVMDTLYPVALEIVKRHVAPEAYAEIERYYAAMLSSAPKPNHLGLTR